MSALRALAIAGVLGLAAPAAALAQGPWGHPGYGAGYERGQRAGLEDARRGDNFQFTDEGDYRRGDIGYRSQYGNRNRYRDEFRRGFQEGYRSGYGPSYGPSRRGGLPPWSVGPGRGQNRYGTAYQTGLNDGYEAGLDDGRDNRRFDPVGERRYRSGDRGYRREYGSREAYENTYRAAFKEGYARGFADGRRYDDDRRPRGGFFGFGFGF